MANAQLADVGLHGSADRYGELCVHGVIDVRRSFTRDELERAMRATVASFPVLGCVYEARFFRDQWLPVQAPISEMVHVGIQHDLETDTKMWTDRWLDPTRERSFRAVLLPKPEGCRLVLSVSHLATDGAGMAAVVHVFAANLYGVRPLLPVEKRRDVARALDGLRLQHIPVFMRDLVASVRQPWRVWSAGPRNRPYPQDTTANSSSKQVVIGSEMIAALEKRCGKRVRVNDLLVAIVSLISAQRSSYGPITVLYTMDLRRFSQAPHLSVTNASSILTTVIPREATENLADAVRAVEEETKKHRESLAGPAFLILPMLLAGPAPHAYVRLLLPAIQPLLVELPVSRGFIFTNVGKIDQGLGPLVDDIVDIRIVGPSIKNIAAPAIIAFGFRGSIHLELFAPPGISPQALDELENEIRQVIGAV
ncbi:MAG TPA: hypothetical protein PK156_07560 [Polyangium sp.]|nr:hypothetical protein [Polyangium sp.]